MHFYRTSFVDKFGNANVGGRGTREPEDPTGYLASLADRNIASLASRIRSDEGQSSEEVARVSYATPLSLPAYNEVLGCCECRYTRTRS